MKVPHPRLLIGSASLAAVLLIAWADRDETSPGPLSRTHALVPELAAAGECDSCHGGFRESMAEACFECHAEIEEHVAAGRGLHGVLDDDPEACARCHSEHRGASFQLTGERAFAQAGIDDPESYDHWNLGFALGGRHLELDCMECHANAEATILVEGEHRYLGLTSDCASCHDDVHEGRIVRACSECHGQAHPFKDVVAFAHEGSFQPHGAHAAASCRDCHAADGRHAVEVLAGEGTRPDDRSCLACHESPHHVGFVTAVAELTEATPGSSCASCHDAAHDGFAGHEDSMPPELHAAAGFSLAPPHDEATCASCHRPTPREAPDRFESRFLHRDPSSCGACHDDPHAGQFSAGPFADAGCVGCHTPLAFSPPSFGVEDHDLTAFPLKASHRAVGCDRCHLVPPEQSGAHRLFRGTPTACANCHEDVHRGAFANSQPAGSSCEACHSSLLFTDVDESSFDHGHWTTFALEGAHAEAACEACHPRDLDPEVGTRTFGFAADVFGEPVDACATCHSNPHGERFADRSHPEERHECARCHTTTSFDETIAGTFEHERWTGFALDGAHGEAECSACHAPRERADEHGRRFGRVVDLFGEPVDRCATCHADVHADAFEQPTAPSVVEGRAGCARCHETSSFAARLLPEFDHDLWTGYSIGGVHAELACASCHAPLDGPAPSGRTTRRAAGRACSDCHADPHVGQFAVQGNTDCARCHVPDGVLDFDHRTESRFPLDEQHDALACSSCHVPWPLTNGTEAVRYRPLGLECADCHGADFKGDGGKR